MVVVSLMVIAVRASVVNTFVVVAVIGARSLMSILFIIISSAHRGAGTIELLLILRVSHFHMDTTTTSLEMA